MTTFNFSQNTKQMKPKKKDFENLWKYRPSGETRFIIMLEITYDFLTE